MQSTVYLMANRFCSNCGLKGRFVIQSLETDRTHLSYVNNINWPLNTTLVLASY